MNTQKLKDRQMELKNAHDKVFDRIQELQNELSQLSAQRLQLEGAFAEVTELLKDADEDKSTEDKDDGALN